ncbi:DUF2591 family protein [Halomonas elongata]|uniref:phage protein NinX family protein n=1 Tax=Halomonas elongata TaxID=2746 RepID=UPI00255B0B79|nr:phage protein NinX family protein [Halomonas elongata]MDL4862073.1 DUF2591 family protein [Halomonas elongata]
MITKTSELMGPALDWSVAKAQGDHCVINAGFFEKVRFSTDWSQGGPLIERYIGATQYEGDRDPIEPFYAETRCENMEAYANGPTPLIAAMRAIVAAELGDEVDVPDELAMDRRGEEES